VPSNFMHMLSKKWFVISMIFFSTLLAAAISVRPLIIWFVRGQLKSTFAQSDVSIKACLWHPKRELSLIGISIKRRGAYDIKISQAGVNYSLAEIVKTGTLRLFLKDVTVNINTPGKKVSELYKYLNISPGKPIFSFLQLSNLNIDVNTQDLGAKGDISLSFDIPQRSLEYLDLKMSNFRMQAAKAKNCLAKLEPDYHQGQFSVSQIDYDKLKIEGIQGKFRLTDLDVTFYDIKASVLQGSIFANFSLSVGEEPEYTANLRCTDVNIEKFVRDFKLGDKFDMTGKLSGGLSLRGKGSRVEILGGNFATLAPGGELVVKDAKFLENMARSTRQPMDLLVDSFKDYHYNTGQLSVGLQGDAVELKVSLEGEAGKRNLSILLHGLGIAGSAK
jgi:hypothetical protein